jgi:cytoskeletal protein RodZ
MMSKKDHAIKENQEKSTQPQDGAQGGALLAEKRKEQGLSQAAVAKLLNLSKQKIQIIETNDFPDQQLDVYYRGYIRAYAKTLKIDVDTIFESIAACDINLGRMPLMANNLNHEKKMPPFNSLIKNPTKKKPMMLMIGSLTLFMGLFLLTKIKHNISSQPISSASHQTQIIQETQNWGESQAYHVDKKPTTPNPSNHALENDNIAGKTEHAMNHTITIHNDTSKS